MKISLTVILIICLSIFVYAQSFLVTPSIPDNSLYINPVYQFETPKKSHESNDVRVEVEEEIFLDGIFKIDSDFYVVLNNELYKKGDKNQKFQVVDINMESVTLLIKNKKVVKYVKND